MNILLDECTPRVVKKRLPELNGYQVKRDCLSRLFCLKGL